MTASPGTITVAALFVHPIKSAARIPVDNMELDARGACGDRRWMLVDGDGLAITQRDHSRLALVQPSFAGADRNGALHVTAPGMQPILLAIAADAMDRDVRIWDDRMTALDAGDDVATWMSEAIGAHCRAVRMRDDARRPLGAKHSGDVSHLERDVALPDAAPLLLLGQASIDALNSRLLERGESAVSDVRFRPNVLLAGTGPHEEDTWSSVEIGRVTVGVGGPCARCVVTTVDQRTAERGVEPLRTLSAYRRQDGKVMFAVNATHAAPGTINTGDSLRVVRTRSPN